MLDNLERDQILHNGKYRSTTAARPSTGLANTNPVATPGSPLGWDMFASHYAGDSPKEILERLADSVFAVQEVEDVDIWLRSAEGVVEIRVKRANEKTKPKLPGQIVLFKKIMEDWGFDEQEAATLLGLDAPSDVRDIYDGRKPVVHRDANDRLRAILRIAADLDALYRDVRAIQDWLNEPQKDLGGATPRSLLQEGSMENLLTVKYYVSHLSGR
jgi:hypothetical protein